MAFESHANEIVYYQITQLSEQKYKLAIPFAEHKFDPFGRIIFAIVLFESLSITLCRVLFSSLYLQICIFYHGIISISGPTGGLLIPTGSTILKRQQCDVCAWPEIDSKGHLCLLELLTHLLNQLICIISAIETPGGNRILIFLTRIWFALLTMSI
jgi:hypothetical protein